MRAYYVCGQFDGMLLQLFNIVLSSCTNTVMQYDIELVQLCNTVYSQYNNAISYGLVQYGDTVLSGCVVSQYDNEIQY